ncbi:arylamine N-acetyltransferase [Allokutzneria sp. A3M-2-11 16]|uniref:arylamine N-acetyltransferase family protein n=1 Tax=Allokutzneria sp. A3M-2-11 16 TaxID=2962043 RepID=UPI0020B70EC5|nr:arylamine N-acetyltransferase [Allokutzneria sp. A3M-2-11 16]MCP3802934.1 arylamine N-acetyltransferase [Allokutzneria sp. A3M-2-11 16]
MLDRIGNPDPADLTAVHRAWRRSVPYENIDIQLGRTIDLAPEVLRDKFGRRRRGGTCFEANGALGLLLADIGFTVTVHEAAVKGRWGNHIALLVTTGDGVWLADAGIADGFVEPLPLRAGEHRQGELTYRLERLDADTWRWHHHERGLIDFYDFRLAPRPLTDFAERARVRPADSPFERLLLAYHGEWGLRARTLIRTGEARTLSTIAEFASVLAEKFAVPLDDLGVDGLNRLWARTGEQHEAWLAQSTSASVAPAQATARTVFHSVQFRT